MTSETSLYSVFHKKYENVIIYRVFRLEKLNLKLLLGNNVSFKNIFGRLSRKLIPKQILLKTFYFNPLVFEIKACCGTSARLYTVLNLIITARLWRYCRYNWACSAYFLPPLLHAARLSLPPTSCR